MKASAKLACLAGLAMTLASSAASALTVGLDYLEVVRNGSVTYFHDNFDNNAFPAGAGGDSQAGYGFLRGSIGEQAGKVFLDSSSAIATPNAAGMMNQTARFTVLTPQGAGGLTSADTFAVRAVFDLATMENGDSYGVRFVDRDAGGSNALSNDFLQIAIANTGTANVIRLVDQDFAAGNAITLQSFNMAAKPAGTQQVALKLTHANAANNIVTASFEYLDAMGMTLASVNFNVASSIFSNENFTRAEVFASNRIPEPASMALVAAGLGLLACARRHRKPA